MDRPAPVVRPADDSDIPAAIAVATAALGWDPAEPNEALFRWKHLDNPAGRSPMWLAVDGPEIAGFRTMMRWVFTDQSRGEVRAVRAVDTATHPDHQRRGVFRLLTTAAIDALIDEGVEFVFNTPNEQSRPGYLQMGWRDVGRIATRVSIRSAGALRRLVRARTPAAKWSHPISAGIAVSDLADDFADLVARLPSVAGLATRRSAEHLLWRYGFEPLHYRALCDDEGVAIVRVRSRGPAREAVLAEMLSPDVATSRRLLARVHHELDVDHVLTLGRTPHPAPWLPSLPRIGPRLTVRDLAATAPDRNDVCLALGDIELF